MKKNRTHSFCVAPMMDWTDRHCRAFHRLLSPDVRLYTEMVTADAVLKGDRARLLGFSEEEHPVALQLGGSDPVKLAEAARIGEDFGYDEINLNVGCPSDRVQSGRFGACLMREPDLVAACVSAMRGAVARPVTVKCRIGVDDDDPNLRLFEFVARVADAGCDTFIVHARKAWLKGLSPKENRSVPPLDYDIVRRLRDARPDLKVIINGGIVIKEEALSFANEFDGVMLGRAAYERPFLLAELFEAISGRAAPSREEIVRRMASYTKAHIARGGRARDVTRHMLGLFHGNPGARAWRRTLSEAPPDAPATVLLDALAHVDGRIITSAA